MTLRERMKIDRDKRHKARRKIRAKALNSTAYRTAMVRIKYNLKRAITQKKIEKFRKLNLVKV